MTPTATATRTTVVTKRARARPSAASTADRIPKNRPRESLQLLSCVASAANSAGVRSAAPSRVEVLHGGSPLELWIIDGSFSLVQCVVKTNLVEQPHSGSHLCFFPFGC